MFKLVRNPDPRKKPPYGSRLDPTHPLSQGLVGCWLLNEGGGNNIFNLASGRAAAFHNSPVWDYTGVVVDDASSQYIEDSSFPMITDTDDFSILVYANVYNIDTSTSVFCGSKVSGSSGGWAFKPEQYQDTSEVGLTFMGVGDYTSNIATPVGEENLFAITRKGGSSTVDLYVDTQVDQLTVGTMDSSTEVNGLVIGASYFGGSYKDYLDGKIITVYIFNRKITSNEIAQIRSEPYAHILVPQYWHMVDFIFTGGGETVEVSATLGYGLGLSSSATAAATASVNLDSSLGVEQGNQASASAEVSLAELLGMSASAVASASGSIALGKVLAISCSGELEGAIEVAVTLASSLGISASATATAHGALDLAYALALGVEAKADATAVLALAMQQGISCTFEVGTAVSVELNQRLGLEASVTATTLGSLTLDQTLGISVLAVAMAQAGISLDSVLEITVSGSTISASLTTPDARTYKVSIEVRSYRVEGEDRTYKIKKET